jgi:hypothetical protein
MKHRSAMQVGITVMIVAALVRSERAAIAQQQTTTAAQKMASVEYLVGTWSCAHTVGAFSGTYKTTYAKVLGNVWLKETYEFPPRRFAGGNEPAVTAETLIGYDEPHQAWVRFFANSVGQYFAIRMTEQGTGWSYKYVGFFKRTRPETPDADATFTKRSDAEYLIDGPSYEQGGTPVTEHHICRKV